MTWSPATMFSDLDHTGAREDGKMEREVSDFAKIHSFLDLVTSLIRKGESFFLHTLWNILPFYSFFASIGELTRRSRWMSKKEKALENGQAWTKISLMYTGQPFVIILISVVIWPMSRVIMREIWREKKSGTCENLPASTFPVSVTLNSLFSFELFHLWVLSE